MIVNKKLEDLKTALLAERLKSEIKVLRNKGQRGSVDKKAEKRYERYQDDNKSNQHLQRQINELRKDINKLSNSVAQIVNNQQNHNNYRNNNSSPEKSSNQRNKTIDKNKNKNYRQNNNQSNNRYSKHQSENKFNQSQEYKNINYRHSHKSFYSQPQNDDYLQTLSLHDSHQVQQCLNWKTKPVRQTKQSKERMRKRSLWRQTYDELYAKNQNLYNPRYYNTRY